MATPPAQPSEPEGKSSTEASRKSPAEPGRAAPKADEEQRAVALMVEYMTLKSTKEVQEVISQELQPSRLDYSPIIAAWISAACEKKEVDREQFKVCPLLQCCASTAEASGFAVPPMSRHQLASASEHSRACSYQTRPETAMAFYRGLFYKQALSHLFQGSSGRIMPLWILKTRQAAGGKLEVNCCLGTFVRALLGS